MTILFLVGIVLSIFLQGFFTMSEMAVVSYNRLRLYHRVTQNDRKAHILNDLLKNPTLLFGTILIGVNFFLVVGSEFARLFYLSIGWDPFWALLSQTFLVIIFAELSPMFAARKYPEQLARLGVYPIYWISRLLFPVIWILDGVSRFFRWLLRCPVRQGSYLTREELQKGIGLRGKKAHAYEEEFNALIENIFSLQKQRINSVMQNLSEVSMVSPAMTVKAVRQYLAGKDISIVPVYRKKRSDIVGMLYTKHLIGYDDQELIEGKYVNPWFITEDSSVFDALRQFRQNMLQIAVVLDANGVAVGIMTLDALLTDILQNAIPREALQKTVIIDRSFPSEVPFKEIHRLLMLPNPQIRHRTLESQMASMLGHMPTDGESVRIDSYLFTLEQDRGTGERRVRVTSVVM